MPTSVTPSAVVYNQHSCNPGISGSNPFDSDSDSESELNPRPTRTPGVYVNRKGNHMSNISTASTPPSKVYNQHSRKSGFASSNPFDSDSDSECENLKPTRTFGASVNGMGNHTSNITTTRTPPSKVYNQRPRKSGFSSSIPFDSDSDGELNHKPIRNFSTPMTSEGNDKIPRPVSIDYDGCSSLSSPYSTRNRYSNFSQPGGLENQSVQELEGSAVYKAEETTQKLNDCLKIAEEIREDASRTLVNLHQQSEQITRTHLMAANIEHDLSRGEKLLGSLGGLFSRAWKPKKTREIKGPILTRDDSYARGNGHIDHRQRLGLSSCPSNSRSSPRQYSSAPASAPEKVQEEKEKQDGGLSELSNLLGELKNMAVDMGSEIERQNKALDHLDDDVEELNFRVRGANIRGRRLLGKLT